MECSVILGCLIHEYGELLLIFMFILSYIIAFRYSAQDVSIV